jgi:hypothetical protein
MALTAYAADSCAVWLWPKAGLYWRKCVDNKGSAYCQEAWRRQRQERTHGFLQLEIRREPVIVTTR